MGLNVSLIQALKNVVVAQAAPALITEAAAPSWVDSAIVINGMKGVESLATRATVGFAGSLFAWCAIELATNPDGYVDQFSDWESIPIEQPIVEPEIVEEPYEYADGTPAGDYEIIEGSEPGDYTYYTDKDFGPPAYLASADVGFTTEELMSEGFDVSYALFYASDLAMCQALMARELLTTSDDLGRHLSTGKLLNSTARIPPAELPLPFAFDQFLGNGFNLLMLTEMGLNDDIFGEITDNELHTRFYCGASYLSTLNQYDMISTPIRRKIAKMQSTLAQFRQNNIANGKLSGETLKELDRMIEAIDLVL